jgi:hypothetical protein
MFTPVAHSRQAILWVGRQPAAYAASFHPRIRPGPEGRFDGEWLNRQVQAAEDGQQLAPFGSVFGVAPTEDAAVVQRGGGECGQPGRVKEDEQGQRICALG